MINIFRKTLAYIDFIKKFYEFINMNYLYVEIMSSYLIRYLLVLFVFLLFLFLSATYKIRKIKREIWRYLHYKILYNSYIPLFDKFQKGVHII